MNYELDYRDPKSTALLADWLRATAPENEIFVAAFIVDKDLMRPQWWVRPLFAFIRWRHGHTIWAWKLMEQKTPGACRDLIEATAKHVTDGKDRSTTDAAGGLNALEMLTLGAALQVINDGSNPPR